MNPSSKRRRARNPPRCRARIIVLAVIALAAASSVAATSPAAPSPVPSYEITLRQGQAVDVIVEFDGTAAQREAVEARQSRALLHDDARIVATRALRYRKTKTDVARVVAGSGVSVVRDFPHLPLALWRLGSPAALARLKAQSAVLSVSDDRRVYAVSTPTDLALIEQPQANAAGATGNGTTVEVIDAGIDLTNTAFGTCPEAGAAGCKVVYDQVYYPGTSTDVAHGTNVSGIVIEVAPGANIAMHNVFNGSNAASSDILTAIDWGYANQANYNIVAINMSLGDGNEYTSTCNTISGDSNPFTSAVSLLAQAGIQAVAASGNNAYTGGINFPACTAGVDSVGAVYDSNVGGVTYGGSPPTCTDETSTADQVACFTNMASFLTALAPGVFVTAAGIQLSGTSQATPHVSGAIATLRAAYPREPLAQATTRITSTGTIDSRGGISIPRLNLYAAYEAGARLLLSGSGPTSAVAGTTSTYMLTVKNNGPLIASDVAVTDILPALGTFVPASSSAACSASGTTVTCLLSSPLAVNASTSFTIAVHWNGSGAVFDSAKASSDQIDPLDGESIVGIGAAPPTNADTPLPPWSLALLGLAISATLLVRASGWPCSGVAERTGARNGRSGP
jgi:uncharacterized repeat protein (TIGR01451 family)